MKFDESIPIYLQIKEEIENAVISNALKEDEIVPSIRTLAQQYRLNPQTISNAVSELLNEGLLYKKRGIGMFVQKGARKILRKRKSEEFRKNDLKKIILKGKSLGISKQELMEILESIYVQEEEVK
jgi:DNA-binding transcriptional regulator YhcF (GntR family)